jgi:predicted RNA-binding protein with PUA-like domain
MAVTIAMGRIDGPKWRSRVGDAAGGVEAHGRKRHDRAPARVQELQGLSERDLAVRGEVRETRFLVECGLPMNYLFKEEPSNYSFAMFLRDGGTTWTGVKNPVAQKHLRGVKKGDRVFYYHTGSEKAIVGIARAAADAYADPADPTGRAYVVDLVPVKRLKRPVTLAEVKADRRFAAFALTRVPRLSVMPVAEAEWAALLAMSESA